MTFDHDMGRVIQAMARFRSLTPIAAIPRQDGIPQARNPCRTTDDIAADPQNGLARQPIVALDARIARIIRDSPGLRPLGIEERKSLERASRGGAATDAVG